jgi:dTDP-4-dehydrorhamnose 3,5-epimerase
VLIHETAIAGCFTLRATKHPDRRGQFVKWFSKEAFAEAGLCIEWAEVFSSESHRGVIRGLHYQRPPADHVKLVYCLAGRAVDVVLDLRRGSPSFGQHITVNLSSENPVAVYVPSGCAHGFYAETDNTLMLYQASFGHAPALDSGIRWDSAGINWPTLTPIVSDRDAELPALSDLDTPFQWS